MPGKKPTEKDLAFFQAQLQMMLGLLTGDIRRLEQEALGEGRHGEKQGDEGEGYHQEFSLELLQHDESTVQAVLEALDKVADGSYGRCEDCDGWIRKERLKAMPHARLCIECQRSSESGAA